MTCWLCGCFLPTMKQCDVCGRTYCNGDFTWLGGCVCGNASKATDIKPATPLAAFQRCGDCAGLYVPLAHDSSCPHQSVCLPCCHQHTSTVCNNIRKGRPIGHEVTPPFGTAVHIYTDVMLEWTPGHVRVLRSVRPLMLYTHTGAKYALAPTIGGTKPTMVPHGDHPIKVETRNGWPTVKRAAETYCQTHFEQHAILAPQQDGYMAADKRRGIIYDRVGGVFECITCSFLCKTLADMAAHVGETVDAVEGWPRQDGRQLVHALGHRRYHAYELKPRPDIDNLIYSMINPGEK